MSTGHNLGQTSASNAGGSISQVDYEKWMQRMSPMPDLNTIKEAQTAELARKINQICPRDYHHDPFTSTLSAHFDGIRNNIAAYKDLVDWIQATTTVLEAAYGASSKSPDPVRLRIHLDVLLNGFEAYMNKKDK